MWPLSAGAQASRHPTGRGKDSGTGSCRGAVIDPSENGAWLNGAAQESNLPSAGLRRRTGFEDEPTTAQPRHVRLVRASLWAQPLLGLVVLDDPKLLLLELALPQSPHKSHGARGSEWCDPAAKEDPRDDERKNRDGDCHEKPLAVPLVQLSPPLSRHGGARGCVRGHRAGNMKYAGVRAAYRAGVAPRRFVRNLGSGPLGERSLRSAPTHLLTETLLDGLPRPVQGLGDLRPGRALRTSLLDGGALNLLQDLLHLSKRVKDHQRLVARPDTEHRLAVSSQDFLWDPLDQPGVIEVGRRRVHGLMLERNIWPDESELGPCA
jgi:hypothetical protein